MKILLISLASMLILYIATVTYVVVDAVGTEIASCGSDAWYYTLYFFRTVGHSYRMAAKRLEVMFEKKINDLWDSIDSVFKALGHRIENLLMAWFMAYDFLHVECKKELDLTETGSILLAKQLSQADITNIYREWVLPEMTAVEKDSLIADLGTNPNAVRALLITKGVIKQQHGSYYISRRYLTHRGNHDELIFEEACINAVVDDSPIIVPDNLIYINPHIKEIVEAAEKVAESILPRTEEEEMDMDEDLGNQAFCHFVDLDWKHINGEMSLNFYALLADICRAESFQDTDPEDVQLVYREMLLDRFVNPLRHKHKICTYEEFLKANDPKNPKPAPVHSSKEENSKNNDNTRSWLHNKYVDPDPIIFGSRKKIEGWSQEQIDAEFDRIMAGYAAEEAMAKALEEASKTQAEVASSTEE